MVSGCRYQKLFTCKNVTPHGWKRMQNLKKPPLKIYIITVVIVLMGFFFFGQVFAAEIKLSLSDLQLTREEAAWLKSNTSIKIGGPRAFPPFHYFDNQGHLKGISADYIFAIMNKLGVKLLVEKNLPWSEVLDRAKSGKIDLIPCIAKTADRQVYLNFSTPYLSFPLVILTNKDAPYIGGIEDLHGKILAVMKNNATFIWLERDKIKFDPYFVESPLNKLESISFGKADAGIENLAAASYIIQKYGLVNVKIAAPTPYGNYDLHMAVRKDLPELLGIINKVIHLITPEQHMQIRSEWLSVRYEHGISKVDILKWIIAISIFSMTIIAVVLFWNRTLKKEVLKRQKSEEKFRTAFKTSPNAITLTNIVDGNYIDVNDGFTNMMGYAQEDVIGKSSIALNIWNNPNDRERLVSEIRKYGLVENLEADFISKDGQIKKGLMSARILDIENKDILLAVTEDITEKVKVQKDKISAQKIAAEQKKLALVGQIAGKLAHDFNNILGIIMGNTELSLLDCKDAETRQVLELIFEQTLQGKNLTRNLVAFAKDQEPKQEFFRISDKIDLVVNLMKKDIGEIDLIKENKPGIPKLLADPGMIEHALVNLIQNSIHAVSRVDHPVIFIRTFCNKDTISFEIEDNGCGIPDEYLEAIYEPSFSLKGSKDIAGSYQFDIKGTGYGMSNVKKYIKLHKGSISVNSIVGSGTKFTISLPVFKEELTSEEKIELLEEIIQLERHILLVEDENAISNVQYRVLTNKPFNHKVDVANSGQIAMDFIDRTQYDLISLDYVLPGKINGMDVYNHIRKTDKFIPILFISGNFEFLESIKELKQKDANIDHLSKPCQNKDYVTGINNLLKKRIVPQE